MLIGSLAVMSVVFIVISYVVVQSSFFGDADRSLLAAILLTSALAILTIPACGYVTSVVSLAAYRKLFPQSHTVPSSPAVAIAAAGVPAAQLPPPLPGVHSGEAELDAGQEVSLPGTHAAPLLAYHHQAVRLSPLVPLARNLRWCAHICLTISLAEILFDRAGIMGPVAAIIGWKFVGVGLLYLSTLLYGLHFPLPKAISRLPLERRISPNTVSPGSDTSDLSDRTLQLLASFHRYKICLCVIGALLAGTLANFFMTGTNLIFASLDYFQTGHTSSFGNSLEVLFSIVITGMSLYTGWALASTPFALYFQLQLRLAARKKRLRRSETSDKL